MDKSGAVRLSKIMSERGIASRREADRLIAEGLVFVDGERVSELGTKVSPNAKVELHRKGRERLKGQVTILLNKPVGYVSNMPEKNYPEAIELIEAENLFGEGEFQRTHRKHLAVAGRLDIDSKGLLVFTQDGVIAKQLISDQGLVEKEYIVHLLGDITAAKLERLRFGLSLDGRPLKRAQIDPISDQCLRFVLREGRKRQIRRMCDQVDLRVTGLKRVRIGKIRLGKLPEGQWRYLLPDEKF